MLNGLGDFYFMVGAGCVLLMWFALGAIVILMMSKQHDWEVNDPAWKNGPEDQERFSEEPPHKEPEDDPEWVKHGSGMHNQHD